LVVGLVAVSAQATQGDGGGGGVQQPVLSHVLGQGDEAPTAGGIPCPASTPTTVAGTCVQVLNQWRLSLTLASITPDLDSRVEQRPPQEIPFGNGTGTWVTSGSNLGDGAQVVFNVPGGQSTVSYVSQTNSTSMTVVGQSDPPYYCRIGWNQQGRWIAVRIIYTDVDNGSPGSCATDRLAGDEGTGPAAATPSGAASSTGTPAAAATVVATPQVQGTPTPLASPTSRP
jgi:hypothetical protein